MIESIEAEGVRPVAPVEPLNAMPAPEQAPAMGDALDAKLERRNDVQQDQKTATLRRQYDAFVEQHRETLDWKGLAQVGTIVAIEGEHAIMHVGRHHFMRFDIHRDLHGAVPDVGVRISVSADGAIVRDERTHEQALERGLGR